MLWISIIPIETCSSQIVTRASLLKNCNMSIEISRNLPKPSIVKLNICYYPEHVELATEIMR